VIRDSPTVAQVLAGVRIPGCIQMASALVADVSITAALIYILYDKSNRSKSTGNILSKLMIYIVNRGLIIMYDPSRLAAVTLL